MNKKAILGMILFGSIWGVAEFTVGEMVRNARLPAGIIMTGIIAVGLMTVSRVLYKQRGMQLGMGLIAGGLRILNPFVGCFICSAVSIVTEGALFELVWYWFSEDLSELKRPSIIVSLGIVTGYICFVGGYIITQIVTPMISSAGFSISNLISYLPHILGKGTYAAIIGGAIIPAIMYLKDVEVYRMKDAIYYPIVASSIALCWIIAAVEIVPHLFV